MAKKEGLSKEQLVIPIYLNEKSVLDMLAIIEDGFSAVSEVSNTVQSGSQTTGKISGGVTTKAILDKLLKIQLDVGAERNVSKDQQQTTTLEKVHTNVSLFSKFRSELISSNLLSCKHGETLQIDNIEAGDFIEISGELTKNPMIEIFEKFIDVFKMADIFTDDAQLGQKSMAKNKATKDKNTLKQIEAFIDELKISGTIDFFIESGENTVVLSAQEQYLENDNISEMYGGSFRVLGKVIKVCKNGDSINLLRKNTLGVLSDKNLEEIMQQFQPQELENEFNLPALRYKINAPAIIVIPIAIYS